MSLQAAAQHLASRGRGPDTMLVHMAPREVAGLHALARAAGGKLTTNPDTGLPEAGFLESLLPTLIGAGITAATGGAAAPWMVGLGMGGFEALRTGSLSKGLMAGLGGFGGAGLAGSLMGAGTSAIGADVANSMLAENAAANAAAMAPQTAGQLGAGFEAQMAANGINPVTQAATAAAAPASVTGIPGYQGSAVGLTPPPQPAQFAAQAVEQAAPQTVTQLPSHTPDQIEAAVRQRIEDASLMDKLKAGVGAYADNPSALLTKDMAKYGLAALAPGAMQAMSQTSKPYQGSGPNPYKYRYEESRPEMPYTDSSREARQYVGRYVPYAGGGTVDQMSEQNDMLARLANGGQGYAHGGETHLGDYSDGGRLLKGPGDGVSDSIPAVIGDKRPARLADGEFVIPARIVSELGNGSTDAGARKLYAMMDRIQKTRAKTTGANRVAVNSRADKALPA